VEHIFSFYILFSQKPLSLLKRNSCWKEKGNREFKFIGRGKDVVDEKGKEEGMKRHATENWLLSPYK